MLLSAGIEGNVSLSGSQVTHMAPNGLDYFAPPPGANFEMIGYVQGVFWDVSLGFCKAFRRPFLDVGVAALEENFLALAREIQSRRSWDTSLRRAVSAEADMSTCRIVNILHQRADISKVLRPCTHSFQINQAFSRHNR